MDVLPQPWAQRLADAADRRRDLGRTRTIAAPRGIDFCSNDYLGLRMDSRLAQAGAEAAMRFGSGAGAARLLRGTSPVHESLEAALAAWKGLEACLLFNTGYQANATLLPALTGPGDLICSDALNHASLVDGCRMAKAAGATVRVYPHLDLLALESALAVPRAAGSLALVVTDAIFSMDGDAADLRGLLAVCERHDALLLVDEAHATGLLGATGAGLCEAQGVKGRVPLVMGTLGKALGSFGAFVACSERVRDHLVNTCRGFIFSTALPAPVAAASLEAVRLAQAELWRREKALALADRLRDTLDLPRHPSAIVPVRIGTDAEAVRLAEALQAEGYDIRAVRPPTVPEGTARLRITTGAHLDEAQVEGLAEALRRLKAVP